MTIKLERIYDEKRDDKSYKILIDRLWPRGIKKNKINLWIREIAPTDDLRKWYGHDENKWNEFASRYTEELNRNKKMILFLLDLEKQYKNITLFYASKSPFNNGKVLYAYLNKLKKKVF